MFLCVSARTCKCTHPHAHNHTGRGRGQSLFQLSSEKKNNLSNLKYISSATLQHVVQGDRTEMMKGRNSYQFTVTNDIKLIYYMPLFYYHFSRKKKFFMGSGCLQDIKRCKQGWVPEMKTKLGLLCLTVL